MKYYVEEDDVTYAFDSWCTSNLICIVEDAARNYCEYHGGRDSPWPLTFVILSDNDEELGRFQVDMEYTPTFYTTKVEKED